MLRRPAQLQPGAAGGVRRRLRLHHLRAGRRCHRRRRGDACRRAPTSSKRRSRPATSWSRRRTRTSTSATATRPACSSCRRSAWATPHTVPAELSLFPGVTSVFAGQQRPLCDRKQVILSNGQNAAADFHLFTDVPKAGAPGRVHPERPGQRVRPQYAHLRREVRAALAADIDPRLPGHRDQPGVLGRVRGLQRPGSLHLHRQPAGAVGLCAPTC